MSVDKTKNVSTKGDLPKTSVLVMILLNEVTLGVYQLVWFLRRRKALNHSSPEQRIDGWLAAVVALGAADLVAVFVLGMPAFWAMKPAWASIIQLAYAIAMLMLRFRVKDILVASYNHDLSGLGTFFFGIFYLQYKINRIQPKSTDGSLLGLNQRERPAA